jgi:hypothetical protein
VDYQVQYKTNISQAAWIDLGPAQAATNSILSVSDTITNEQRFYRVLLLP